ncbi:MAG: hypothetical protein Q9M91_00170 [Candidatus Dojkabacteria bacterium]|nr:hypothetical protein [Candidatus Dojkabacteria bacterium]MDQ7020247.1 hypothetical protein [Candidatus Dojkabacteria bacterium]
MSEEYIKELLPYINRGRSFTIFRPPGSGASTLGKLLPFVPKYFYKKIPKKRVIVYFDMDDLTISQNKYGEINLPNNLVFESYKDLVLKKLTAATHGSAMLMGLTIFPMQYSTDNDLWDCLNRLFNKYNTLSIFIYLDNIESVLHKDYENELKVFEFIRNKYRERIHFIFPISKVKTQKEIIFEGQLPLAKQMSHNLIYLKPLPKLVEIIYIEQFVRYRLWHTLVTRRTIKFRNKLKKVKYLSGGYMLYAKALWDMDNISLPESFRSESLVAATRRLTQAFTKTQLSELISFSKNSKTLIPKNDYFLFRDMGIINKKEIFSPILKKHLSGVR